MPRGSQRQGMIVTSTGIVFSTARDGVFYAFDAENGEVLWSYKLADGHRRPAVYLRDRGPALHRGERHHAAHLGLASRESGIGSAEPLGKGGYVVFSMSAKSRR